MVRLEGEEMVVRWRLGRGVTSSSAAEESSRLNSGGGDGVRLPKEERAEEAVLATTTEGAGDGSTAIGGACDDSAEEDSTAIGGACCDDEDRGSTAIGGTDDDSAEESGSSAIGEADDEEVSTAIRGALALALLRWPRLSGGSVSRTGMPIPKVIFGPCREGGKARRSEISCGRTTALENPSSVTVTAAPRRERFAGGSISSLLVVMVVVLRLLRLGEDCGSGAASCGFGKSQSTLERRRVSFRTGGASCGVFI